MKEVSSPSVSVNTTVYPVLFAISFSHLLNDTLQAIVPAIYPLLKADFELSFFQIGLITFVFQVSASLLQPLVGNYTDKHPKPYALAFGMCLSLIGLVTLAYIGSFVGVLVCAVIIGTGSAVFHPEASRLAFLASGGKRGMAQSLFQVGGNAGSAIGPLLAALVITKYGQHSIAWAAVLAILGITILYQLGHWYKVNRLLRQAANKINKAALSNNGLNEEQVKKAMFVLVLLIFTKYIYMTSLGSYYTFYLIEKFNISVKESQLYLFIYMAAIALGTYAGGPIGDRIGRRKVIWFSILGSAPFALLLPFANLFWTNILAVCIGLIISSAFSAILVYAQELRPGKEGAIAGLFFGLAFGVAGIGSALLGALVDVSSLETLFEICSVLPLFGICAMYLPKNQH